MSGNRIVITIDGPAGAGKTTVSRMLAGKLGYTYIDTGALYRSIALHVREMGIDPADDESLGKVCDRMALEFKTGEKGLRLFSSGEDVTDRIREPEIAMLASAVSARPGVRACLLDVQRRMGREKGAVFEGRDMGTVVFPEAEVKFYLDAPLKERALRRYRELPAGSTLTLSRIEADMAKRDKQDSNRDIAPLKPAQDAVIINSSGIPAQRVMEMMLEEIMLKTKG